MDSDASDAETLIDVHPRLPRHRALSRTRGHLQYARQMARFRREQADPHAFRSWLATVPEDLRPAFDRVRELHPSFSVAELVRTPLWRRLERTHVREINAFRRRLDDDVLGTLRTRWLQRQPEVDVVDTAGRPVATWPVQTVGPDFAIVNNLRFVRHGATFGHATHRLRFPDLDVSQHWRNQAWSTALPVPERSRAVHRGLPLPRGDTVRTPVPDWLHDVALCGAAQYNIPSVTLLRHWAYEMAAAVTPLFNKMREPEPDATLLRLVLWICSRQSACYQTAHNNFLVGLHRNRLNCVGFAGYVVSALDHLGQGDHVGIVMTPRHMWLRLLHPVTRRPVCDVDPQGPTLLNLHDDLAAWLIDKPWMDELTFQDDRQDGTFYQGAQARRLIVFNVAHVAHLHLYERAVRWSSTSTDLFHRLDPALLEASVPVPIVADRLLGPDATAPLRAAFAFMITQLRQLSALRERREPGPRR